MNDNPDNSKLTKSMALNAANTSYTSLVGKVISILIARTVCIFLLTVVVFFWIFKEHFEKVAKEFPNIYGYILFFSCVYLAIQLFLTAHVLKKYVVVPLKEFIDAAQMLVSGAKDVRLDVVRSNEFLNLNDSFKFIKNELVEKDKRIESYQKSLEQLIDERTSDLRHALKIAQSTTEAKSEFFANITHELRTPLNGILGMTDLILDSALSAEQRSQLELVRESGNNLLSLVNDFLEYSEIEAGKMSLYNENLDLKKLINRCLLVLSIKAEQKGITIVHKIEDNVPEFIVSDNLRIKQLLQNLISNSIKFSNNCGGIILWVGVKSIEGDNALLHFGVSDAGIGMSRDKVVTIFDTLNGNNSRNSSSGLGLSISREIVHLMNGEVWVKSREGMGTAIHFTISCKISASTRDLSSDDIVLPGRGFAAKEVSKAIRKILICEDNSVNARLVRALVERTGHQVTIVENGELALEKLQAERFDLILMDCQMPEMDGFETTRYIRQKRNILNPDIPIIALTANASPEDMEKCLECGMNDFISKPIEKTKFYEKLKIYLPSQL